MPEWSDFDLKIDALTGGITNKLFRIQISNGEEYVIRVYGEKTDLFIDRHVEMENILLMEPSGVTPRLIKYIPERNVTIVEFIAGTPFKNEDFLAEDLIEKIVRPIQLIHNSGVKLSRLFDPLEETRKLYKILKGVGPEYTEFDILGTLDILGKISAISRIRPSSYLPCHNDLLADNFIMVENQNRYREPVYLIDWEYAGMNTPYYEISDMFQEIIVPKQIEDKILRAYWEDSNMDEHFLKTDMFRPFPDIYWFLWSLIQQNISCIKFDFYNYGRVKYENAQKSIQFLREHYALSI
jgi:thiamine kinase-like enzyme